MADPLVAARNSSLAQKKLSWERRAAGRSPPTFVFSLFAKGCALRTLEPSGPDSTVGNYRSQTVTSLFACVCAAAAPGVLLFEAGVLAMRALEGRFGGAARKFVFPACKVENSGHGKCAPQLCRCCDFSRATCSGLKVRIQNGRGGGCCGGGSGDLIRASGVRPS